MDNQQGQTGVIRKEYENGLVVLVKPMSNTEKVYIDVGIRVGSLDEDPKLQGISHLVEHLHFKSNDISTVDEIAMDLEFSGISRGASTSKSQTHYKMNLPADGIAKALELTYNGIKNVEYDTDEFLKERDGVVLSELVMGKKNLLRTYYGKVLIPKIFAGTSLAGQVIGTKESLGNITLDDIKAFKKKYYVPNNIVISACGNVNIDEFFKGIENTFAKMEYQELPQKMIAWEFQPQFVHTHIEELKDKKDSEQDQAYYFRAYKVPHEVISDDAGVLLLRTMIARGFTGLLFQKLRTDKGIGYGKTFTFLDYEGNAVVVLGVPGLHPNQVKEAHEIIEEICSILTEGNYSTEFFKGKKMQAISLRQSSLEGKTYHARSLILQEWEKPKIQYTDTIQKIEEMSKETITQYAQAIFNQKPMVFIVSSSDYVFDEKDYFSY